MIDLGIDLLDMHFKNPTLLAAGIMDITGSAMKFAFENGAGAVITKSIGLEPRKGHNAPIICVENALMMNAVGLSNPGIDDSIDEILGLRKRVNCPIIASIFGKTKQEFAELAERITHAKPDIIEVNISCPNVDDEFGKPFSLECNSAEAVTRIVKKHTELPIAVKLSPNVPDISKIAKAVEEAGAEAITAINTVGPGMIIDTATAQPVLHNKTGGLSGPAIRPLAVKAVYDIYEKVDIPIMGVGGVTYGDDAIQMLMAGATLTQIGSAVYYRGPDVFHKVCQEIKEFMHAQGYKRVEQLVGLAHEEK